VTPATGGSPEEAASPPAQRELRHLLRVQEQRRRQLPRALLVGLIAGVVAVAFALALEHVELARTAFIERAHGLGAWGVLLPVLLGAATAGSAVAMVVGLAPEAGGSGIPHLKAVLHGLGSLRWKAILPVKFMAGVIGIGGGLALGREGPTVQMGGAIGQMVSGWFRCTPRERATLIAAGAGAGLSAAFNAPLAGLVFVLEEVQRDFAPAVFTVTLVASVVADVTSRLLLGDRPVFDLVAPVAPPLASLPLHLALGVAAAPLGIAFNHVLLSGLDVAARVRLPAWGKGALVGAGIGLIGWFLPHAPGGGASLVHLALAGGLGVMALLWLFPLRLLLTGASYATGAAGGIFTPMLVLGAVLGTGFAEALGGLLPPYLLDPPTFAVVGMAAFFTAVVRAPLTAIVLLVEMTGDYGLVLPLLIACLAAGGIADYLRDAPIYEALLLRDLSRRGAQPPDVGEALVIDLGVGEGSPFDGTRLRDLGLPPGCIVIAVQRALVAEVPTADFVLAGGDRISVLVSPRAAEAVPLLRAGTASPRAHDSPRTHDGSS